VIIKDNYNTENQGDDVDKIIEIIVTNKVTDQFISIWQAYGKIVDGYVYVDKAYLNSVGFFFGPDDKINITERGSVEAGGDAELNRISRYYIIFKLVEEKADHANHIYYSVTLPTTGVTSYIAGNSAGGITWKGNINPEPVLTTDEYKRIKENEEK